MLKRVFGGVLAQNRRKSSGGYMIRLLMIVAWLFFTGSSAFGVDGSRFHYPDVFAREDTRIESGQTVGRLLVTGGNATVSGVVEKGIVVVDGNLFLTPDAHVKGTTLVLGGDIKIEAGSRMEKTMLALAPLEIPVAEFLVLGLLLLGVFSLVTFPIAMWLLIRVITSALPYLWMKERFYRRERHWTTLRIVFVLSVGVLLLTFFAEMAYETLIRHQMDVFDNVFVWVVRYLASQELDRAMIVISEFGYGYPFGAIILIAMSTLVFYRQWLEAIGLFICLIGEAVLNFLFKNLFERSRPDLFRVVEEAGYSFPSGHAMVSVCFYGMIAYLIMRHISNWHWRLVVITLTLALIAAIGVSRVYLGVHYPTDVVAGYFAGGMWLAFCISLLIWRESRRMEKDSGRTFPID